MLSGWRTVRVPASSANLGPGFDALGLAFDIHLECRFRSAPELTIRATGRDAQLISTGADNLIWQTALECGEVAPIELEIHNHIPLGKGLGSSAAAITAGLAIGSEMLGLQWDRARMLNEAARIEGHPDNAGACVLGGLVTAATDSAGVSYGVRLEIHPRFRAAVVVPDFDLPTRESRQALPEFYSRQDAIFNIQRAALLIEALKTGAGEAFPMVLEDRLHQPYRFPLVPGLEEMTRLRAPGLLGCALSGAGPSVLVFYERGHEQVCEMVQQVFTSRGRASEILYTGIAACGYQISEESF